MVTQTALIEQARRWKAGYTAALNALTQVLAARLIVLVAVIGAGILSYIALQNPDPYKIGILAIYCFGVVGATVYLAGR